ncbi:MAG: hypothetical protein U1E76_21050 [Planctomycetota bacterium]
MLGLIKWAVAGAAVAGGALFLVGADRLKLYAEHGKHVVQEKISEITGLEGQLDAINTKIDGLDKEILHLKEKMIEQRVETSTLKQTVEERDAQLGRLKTNLEKASRLLSEPRDSFVIGRIAYTRHEVEADAEEKLHTYQLQADSIKNMRETLKMKENALKISEENVARGESLKTELEAKVRLLTAKLERYRAKQVLVEATATAIPTDELKTELGSAHAMLRDFEKQLEVKDRMLDERMKLAPAKVEHVSGIDYESNGEDTADIATMIQRYFAGNGTIVSVPQAEVAQQVQ